MTKDKEFPKTDWGLCKRPESRIMIGGLCMYQGFLTEWGECKVPGIKQFVCHPIKKYQLDLNRKATGELDLLSKLLGISTGIAEENQKKNDFKFIMNSPITKYWEK